MFKDISRLTINGYHLFAEVIVHNTSYTPAPPLVVEGLLDEEEPLLFCVGMGESIISVAAKSQL